MDRRNGGDPQAPPRPPKNFPRVHRPRAPEPMEILNATATTTTTAAIATTATTTTGASTVATQRTNDQQTLQQQQHQQQPRTTSRATSEGRTVGTVGTIEIPSTLSRPPPLPPPPAATLQGTNINQQQLQQHKLSGGKSLSHEQQQLSITIPPATTTTTATNYLSGSGSSIPYTGATFLIHTDASLLENPDYDDSPTHHLIYLPQRPSSLSRNSSHVSTSSSSSITAANSFTRRRLPATPGAAVPLLTISGGSGSGSGGGGGGGGGSGSTSGSTSSITGNFFSHFHHSSSTADTTASTVTLAQPRPESQRLTNEYVETPLRQTTATPTHHYLHQLHHHHNFQHATRIQHPAGQHDNSQTTTHHALLLPQRDLRLQQQTTVTAGGLVSVAASSATQQQSLLQHLPTHSTTTTTTTTTTSTTTHVGAGTAGSASVAATNNTLQPPTSATAAAAIAAAATLSGTDRTDGLLHSRNQQQPSKLSSSATPEKVITPPPPPRGNLLPQQQIEMESAITKQPASTTNCKSQGVDLLEIHNTPTSTTNHPNANHHDGRPIIISGGLASKNSITCPRCGLCRCEQCKTPRSLPQKWLCNKTCLCSAESIIDYASCLCCAKALFYHCASDNDLDYGDGTDSPFLGDPCSCSPFKRVERWSCLGALSLVLPCLWFYWPLRGCAVLCEKFYGRYAGRGCQCNQQQIGSTTSSMLPIMPSAINGINSPNNSPNANNSDANAKIKGISNSADDDDHVRYHHHHQHQHQHHHHHHHHHHGESMASRMLRKGNLTPEKRLLDSSPEL